MDEKHVTSYAALSHQQLGDLIERMTTSHCRAWSLDARDPKQKLAAQRAVLLNFPRLADAYVGKRVPLEELRERPDLEVHHRTRAWMREKGVKDYAEAMHAVLEEDPDLKAQYVGRR